MIAVGTGVDVLMTSTVGVGDGAGEGDGVGVATLPMGPKPLLLLKRVVAMEESVKVPFAINKSPSVVKTWISSNSPSGVHGPTQMTLIGEPAASQE